MRQSFVHPCVVRRHWKHTQISIMGADVLGSHRGSVRTKATVEPKGFLVQSQGRAPRSRDWEDIQSPASWTQHEGRPSKGAQPSCSPDLRPQLRPRA